MSIGPIISLKQLRSHLDHIAGARKAGARQLLGGDPQGQVLPPHVFVDVTNDMRVAQEEMFAPIASIIKVNGDEEALRTANDTQYGLSSAVFTRDQERALRVRHLQMQKTLIGWKAISTVIGLRRYESPFARPCRAL